jgi:MoxR-like ATPase
MISLYLYGSVFAIWFVYFLYKALSIIIAIHAHNKSFEEDLLQRVRLKIYWGPADDELNNQIVNPNKSDNNNEINRIAEIVEAERLLMLNEGISEISKSERLSIIKKIFINSLSFS